MGHNKRQGFTLVELLIVIAVVGILSTISMLAGKQAQSAAKATKIVNGLTDVKMAVLTWYRENTDKIDKNGKINTQDPNAYFTKDSFSKYLNDKNFTIGTSDGNYQIVFGTNNNGKPTWYVCYHLEKNKSDTNDIKTKLLDKATAQPWHLLQNSGSKWENYSNADDIYMEILTFDF